MIEGIMKNFKGANMKSVTVTLLLAAVLMMTTAFAGDPADNLKISAQMRARAEGFNRMFSSDYATRSFALLRTRVNLDFYKGLPVSGFIQFQDSRVMGDSSLGSGRLNNDMNVGIHQAYVLLDNPCIDDLYMKIGRFEYVKGNERLFGSVGWSNVGRTWDGAIIGYDNGKVRVEGLAFVKNERVINVNDDAFVTGIYTQILGPQIDLFAILDLDMKRDSLDNIFMNRFTVGFYHHGSNTQFDYTTNLAFQSGKTMYDSMDIGAYLATIEVGFTPETAPQFRLAAGVDITSGDDDFTDDELNAFNNMYYTGHKFRGHMDYFVNSKYFDLNYGLHDFYLTGRYNPKKKTSLNGQFHYFASDASYFSVIDSNKVTALGIEADLFVKHKLYDRFAAQVGASFFIPAEDAVGENPDPGWWLSLQTTASF